MLIFKAILAQTLYSEIKSYVYDIYRRRQAKKVHQSALTKVMQGSINKYFDITPIGRVLSRFMSDMNSFNFGTMYTIRSMFGNFSQGLFFCWFLGSITIWSVFPIVIAMFLTARFSVYASRVRIKVQRILAAQRSPQISILHQSLTGKATIRVF